MTGLWPDIPSSILITRVLDSRSSKATQGVLSKIVTAISGQEECMCIFSWYARVPSLGNVADAPSRNVADPILPESSRIVVDSDLIVQSL